MTHPLTPSQVAAYLAKEKLDKVKNASGMEVLQETSRPPGTKTYFTSEGDDTTDATKVGDGGNFFQIDHKIGNDETQNVYVDFNIAENITYIHEGYIQWSNAHLDTITLSIVNHATTTTADTGTEFKLYNGYLIVGSSFPLGSEININGKTTVASLTDSDVKLVYTPISRDTGVRPSAYWNATYNTATHQYENITYAPFGDGEYNMFAVEIPLERFVNKSKLIGSGFMMLQSADSSQLGQNMRLKFTSFTYDHGASDHDWIVTAMLTLHRQKTI